MDNEVMIDGVNVAGCEFYDKSSKWSCKMYIDQYGDADCACDEYGMNNCYYKQLQRLKSEKDTQSSLMDFYQQKIEVLQAENEELKQWQEDAENILKTQLDNFDNVENRYKQTLKEIKEVITRINYTIASKESISKQEWMELHHNIIFNVLRIIREVLKDE